MRTEKEIQQMLDKIKEFIKTEGRSIEEMNGEVYALEYVLEKRDDLF